MSIGDTSASDFCLCGQPLHYPTPEAREAIEQVIREAGTHILVNCGYACYSVDRHYAALHMLTGQGLERLALLGRIERVGRGCKGCDQ